MEHLNRLEGGTGVNQENICKKNTAEGGKYLCKGVRKKVRQEKGLKCTGMEFELLRGQISVHQGWKTTRLSPLCPWISFFNLWDKEPNPMLVATKGEYLLSRFKVKGLLVDAVKKRGGGQKDMRQEIVRTQIIQTWFHYKDFEFYPSRTGSPWVQSTGVTQSDALFFISIWVKNSEREKEWKQGVQSEARHESLVAWTIRVSFKYLIHFYQYTLGFEPHEAKN